MRSTAETKEVLLKLFPVRRSGAQKADFREWLAREMKGAGYRCKEERYGKTNGSVNVVAGDPDRATVFLVAHYDTPSRMLVPNFVSPTNVPAHFLYHFVTAFLLLALALVVSFAVTFPINQPKATFPLFVLLALGVLFWTAFGPPNRSNANGNTSGVAALLAIAARVPRDKRVCFVFLDNSERNFLGAGAFRKQHMAAGDNCLFFNFDCVGDGDHFLFLLSRVCRWDGDLINALLDAFPAAGEKQAHVLDKGMMYYPSDHRKFKFHVAVCACRRLAGLGYYIPHLRSRRDTVLEVANIDYLAEGMARFLPLYLKQGAEAPQKD